ncbi:helix-turn-helix domain-containing protein [Cellulomonas sp. A375-1]|uniref:helix-turn-helix domain-containing protein n=1 Tax=Cellulomonas sp. A375-1 TaxID=1672219 RepID=UPI0018CD4B96|nr:helix-turn-helix domain-containing protein [Cellulomonas sp. A375-1]
MDDYEREVLDWVSLTLPQAVRRYRMDWLLLRWRIEIDMTPHFFDRPGSRLLVRSAEIEPWYREAIRLGLANRPRAEWPLDAIVDRVTEQPVFSFISCTVKKAAEKTGVSEGTIRQAIDDGVLASHRAGARGGRIIVRAVDLDAWVQALPAWGWRDRRWR